MRNGNHRIDLTNFRSARFLGEVDLSGNLLDGEIPSSLYQAGIKLLRVSGNADIQGLIPALIGNMTNLRVFGAGRTKMNGPIPTSIYSLPNLAELDLSQAAFSGGISDLVGQLNATLVKLYLGDNVLSGALPTTLGELSILEELTVDKNDLTGSIPQSLCARRGYYGGMFSVVQVDCNVVCTCCNNECNPDRLLTI